MQFDFVSAVSDAVRAGSLAAPGDHLLVAVSGGADSMALAHVLLALRDEWKWTLTVAHLDHGLRADAGRADLDFVRQWTERQGLAFAGRSEDVARRAEEGGLSIEEAAREVRYAFLVETAGATGAAAIATGHTQEDQAETVLLRMLRGAGAGGLRGMAPRSLRDGVPLIRPLLDRTRAEILNYLSGLGQPFREDATNRDLRFQRNLLRHEVLPLLARIVHPGVREGLVRTSRILAGEDDWMEAMAAELVERMRVPGEPEALEVGGLAALPVAAQRRVVRSWVLSGGGPCPDFAATARILSLLSSTEGSAQAPLGEGWQVVRSYGQLRLCEARASDRPEGSDRLTLRCPGETLWPELGLRFVVEETVGCVVREARGIGNWPASASVRRDAGGGRDLTVRRWRPGDRLAPTGMDGTKKVQDIFADEKVDRHRRREIPLVWSGDELVWVPGYRVSRHGSVADGEPSYTLRIESGDQRAKGGTFSG